VSRRRNYGFERRRREATRRSRQEAKRERRAERAAQGRTGPEIGAPEGVGAPPGRWEWFSPSRGRVVASPPGERPAGEAPDDWVLLTEVAEEPPAADG